LLKFLIIRSIRTATFITSILISIICIHNLLRANVANSLLDAEAKTITNKYLDDQQQADLNVKAAHYEELMLRGQLHVREAKESLSREILNYARANGQRISNRIAEKTADKLIFATNAANYYEGMYNTYRGQKVKLDAASDFLGNQWQNQLTGELLNSKRWDNEMLFSFGNKKNC
jgi:hypothetical protein